MIANIIIGLVVAILFVLAVRHAVKKRGCDCGGTCGGGKECHCCKGSK